MAEDAELVGREKFCEVDRGIAACAGTAYIEESQTTERPYFQRLSY